MVIKKRVLFLLLVLLLLPQVVALEVSDLSFTWGGRTVQYYSDNTPITVNIEMTISSDSLEGIVLDISDINNAFTYSSLTDHYESVSISDASCDSVSEEKFECILRNVILRKSEPESSIIVTKGSETSSVNVTLQRTNANPRVTFIGTENCHEDKCYSTSGLSSLLLNFENSDAGFYRGMISFSALGDSGSVYNCSSTSCEGIINLQCAEGQEVFVSISPFRGRPSADDAGRSITGPSFSVICDDTPPVIEGIQVVAARDIGITEISETFRVVANVSDAVSPVIKMKVIGDDINTNNVTGDCVLREGLFHCSANVRAAVPERGFYDVPVIFSDLAGNEVIEVLSVELVEIDREETPNFWSVSNVVQSTDSMNVRNMANERTVYTQVSLQGIADLLRVRGQAGRCTPVSDQTGQEGDITKFDVTNFDSENNLVYVRLGIRETGLQSPGHRYSDFRRLEYNCALEIYSAFDGFFYSKPQNLNFTFLINLDDRETLTDKVQREIEEVRDDLESRQAFFDAWDTGMAGAMTLCGMLTGFDSAAALLSSSGGVLEAAAMMGVGSIGQGAPFVEAGDKINVMTKESMKPIVVACNILSCKKSPTESVLGFSVLDSLNNIPYSQEVSQFLGRSEYSDFYNPYDSIFSAFITQCAPAIVHHLKVLQSINCNYLDCINSGFLEYGQSMTYCGAERDYSRCVYFWTGVLDAVPVLNVIRDASERFSEVLSNPINLVGFATPLICTALDNLGGTSTITKSVCLGTVFVQSIGTFASTVSSIGVQIENLNRVNPAPFCNEPLANADAIISARFDHERRVGHYPQGFVFEHDKPVTNNVHLVYDDASSDFFLYDLSTNEVLGFMSPNDFRYDDRNFEFDSFNFYSVDGKFLGNLNEEGLTAEGAFKEYLDLRNAYAAASVAHASDDTRETRQELQRAKASLEGHDLHFFDGLLDENDEIDTMLYTRAEAANKEKYEALLNQYPDLEEYYVAVLDSTSSYYDIRKNLEPIIAELDDAASGISFWDRNDDVNELREELEKEYEERGCLGEASESSDCLDMWDKLFHYDSVIDLCKNELDEGVECTRSNLRSRSRDLSRDIKSAERNMSRAQRVATIEQSFEDYFGDFSSAMSTAWGVSSSITTLRNVGSAMGLESSTDFSRHTTLGQLSQSLADFGTADWGICDSRLAPTIPETGGIMIKSGEAGHRPGVYLVGRKSSRQEPSGEDHYYNYWVEGGIYTSGGGDLRYKIFMYKGNNKVDVTELVIRDEEPYASKGRPERFGGIGSSPFRHEYDFDRVCIEFETSHLREYFDVVQISGNTVCQKLVRE